MPGSLVLARKDAQQLQQAFSPHPEREDLPLFLEGSKCTDLRGVNYKIVEKDILASLITSYPQ